MREFGSFFDSNDAQHRACGLVKLIRDNEWLINSYVVEFFSSDHWRKFPKDWQEFFEDITPQQCYEFVGCVADFEMMCVFFKR